MNTITATPTELLVLSGSGIRFGVPGHYGLFDETATFDTAVKAARAKLASGSARAFVAIRIEARVIDGIGDGTERELVRFEIYPDRVALVPTDQGGLSDEQKAKGARAAEEGSTVMDDTAVRRRPVPPRTHCPPSRRGHTWRELPIVPPSEGGPTIRELHELRQCTRCKALGRVDSQGCIRVVEGM